jgi:Predicted DNA-binding protein containing PIN domain
MEKYVLDTNIFFNMSAGINLGQKTEEVVINLTEIIKKLKEKNKADFFVPPTIIDEFLSFFENKNQPFLKEFISLLTIKSPKIDKINFPSRIFYLLIEDIRSRHFRGLNIAEEEIKNAAKKFLLINEKLSEKEFQIKLGETIRKFRERFRQATRFGFLDSVADLDLIVLANEIDGYLVSTDEGVIKWAKTFGTKIMPAEVWVRRMKHLLEE